jgi:hypothetical protein
MRTLAPAFFRGDSHPWNIGIAQADNGQYEPVVRRDLIDDYGDYKFEFWKLTDEYVQIEQPDHSMLSYRVYDRVSA